MAILSSTGFYGFVSSCRKQGKSYISTFREKVCGWKLWEYTVGKYRFEVDEVKVRDRFQSSDHDPLVSDLSRKGFLIETNYEGISGYSRAEFDEIYVRKRAVFKEVVIEQLNTIAGGLVISAAHGKIAAVENGLYEGSSSCFVVLDEESSGSSDFIRGDMALCERASYEEGAGSFEKKRYWMLVEKSGKTSDADCPLSSSMKALGKRYVLLSRKQCEERGGTPSEGDVIVQFGYISEHGSIASENEAAIHDRQRAVLISQLGSTRAAFAEYQGIGATKPYFKLDDTRHEVTRICGEGSNKFTGDFVISSGKKIEAYVEDSQKDIRENVDRIDVEMNDTFQQVFSESDSNFTVLSGRITASVGESKKYVDGRVETLNSELELIPGKISASVSDSKNYTDGKLSEVKSDLELVPGKISAVVEGYKNAGLEIKLEGEGELQTSSIELNAEQIAIKNGSEVAAFFEKGKLNAGLIDVDSLLADRQIMMGDLPIDRNEDKCPDLDKITKEYTAIYSFDYESNGELAYRSGKTSLSLMDYKNQHGGSKGLSYAKCEVESLVDTYHTRNFEVNFSEIYGEEEGDFDSLQEPYCNVSIDLIAQTEDGSKSVLASLEYKNLLMNRRGDPEYYFVMSDGAPSMKSDGKYYKFKTLPKGTLVSYDIHIHPHYKNKESVVTDLNYKIKNFYVWYGKRKIGKTPILMSQSMTKFFKDGFFCYNSPLNYIYYRLNDRYEVVVSEEELVIGDEFTTPMIQAKKMSGQLIRLSDDSSIPMVLKKAGNKYAYYNVVTESTSVCDGKNSYDLFDMYKG